MEEAILEYASRMENGSPAPAPIIHRTDKGASVLDGVQRLCAGKLMNYTVFPAYSVETDSLLSAMKIRVLANHLLAGHPEPTEWSRRRAIQLLCIEGGMSMQEVARLGGWTLKSVEDDKVYMDYNSAIIHVGGPQDLAKGLVLTIAGTAKMDDFRLAPKPLASFFNHLKEGRFSNGESTPFIKEFFKVQRKDRAAVHDQFAENLKDFKLHPEVQARLDGRRHSRMGPDIRLRKAIRTTITVLDSMLEEGVSVPYVQEFKDLWGEVDVKLDILVAAKRKRVKV